MSGVSLIRTITESARAGLFAAAKLLSDDLPLCDRFRERGPTVLSEEKSSPGVQRDIFEPAPKLPGISSQLPSEEDEKKRKRVMPIAIRLTSATL
jgi:hypothetical protein